MLSMIVIDLFMVSSPVIHYGGPPEWKPSSLDSSSLDQNSDPNGYQTPRGARGPIPVGDTPTTVGFQSFDSPVSHTSLFGSAKRSREENRRNVRFDSDVAIRLYDDDFESVIDEVVVKMKKCGGTSESRVHELVHMTENNPLTDFRRPRSHGRHWDHASDLLQGSFAGTPCEGYDDGTSLWIMENMVCDADLMTVSG
jgi:hypothetical protein